MRDGECVAETATDAFGEFKIDGLEAGDEEYLLCLSHEGHADLDLPVRIEQSVFLHDLRPDRR